ncbi:MAG: hypothetical protein Q9178_002857 [Gyalolechia marmorata]
MADTKLPLHTVQRKPKFDSLPQEVYDLIFQHASSPRKRLKRYLWPLLFVSKRIYHAVLPSLYRRISFNVDSSVGSYEANYKLLQLADKENQGLLHIQGIVLCPDDELERKPHDAADYPDAIQLLAAIPRNQLRKFRRQKRADSREFWGIKEEIGNLMDLPNLDDNGYTTLQRLKNAYQDGLLRDLFGLHGVDLSHSPQYIFHAINLAVLESLEIVGCYRTDIILAAMAQLPVNKRPRLRQLDVYVEEEEMVWVSDADHTDRTVSSINEVLLSMKDSLDNLWIVIRGIDGPGKLLSPLAHGIANQAAPYIAGPYNVRDSATVPEDFYHHCLEYVARDIMALRDKLINHPTRRLDIIGFGLPEEDHYMAGLKHPLEPVYFVSELITSLGKPFTWIRQASLTEIEESPMHDRIDEVQDIDWLAKGGIRYRRNARR